MHAFTTCPSKIKLLALFSLVGPFVLSAFADGPWSAKIVISLIMMVPLSAISATLSLSMAQPWIEALLVSRTRGSMVRDLGFEGYDMIGVRVRRRS